MKISKLGFFSATVLLPSLLFTTTMTMTKAFITVRAPHGSVPLFKTMPSSTRMVDSSTTETTVKVNDLDEAVEALVEAEIFEPPEEEPEENEDENEIIVTIERDLPKPPADVDKQSLTEDIEQVLLENNATFTPDVEDIPSRDTTVELPLDKETPDTTQPSQRRGSRISRAFASDVFARFRRALAPKHTAKEAAISASLYMNPATAKIASNLVITWEPGAAELLAQMTRVSNPNRPFMVGLVGIPGSGKSTSSDILAALLSAADTQREAVVMPMDGFHLPLEILGQMPDASDRIYRRGAPDTFDPHGLAMSLERITAGDEESVTIPGFDHAKGDPVPDQHTFDRSLHNIVICEGIYLLHNNDGWENIKRYFDWTIYIDADVDACVERLKERNKCIPGYTPEEIATRCDVVDRANALLSRDSARKFASQIVQSGAS